MSRRTLPRRQWIITRTKRHVTLTHVDESGDHEQLGRLDAGVCDDAVVEWVVRHGGPRPHDEIVMSTGDRVRWEDGRLRLYMAVLPDMTVFCNGNARA